MPFVDYTIDFAGGGSVTSSVFGFLRAKEMPVSFSIFSFLIHDWSVMYDFIAGLFIIYHGITKWSENMSFITLCKSI